MARSRTLTHEQVWEALDALAEKYDLSASGLARAAGLDPTTFNKSKRIGPDGRPRWPSTESLSKAMQAVGSSLDEFVTLIGANGQPQGRMVPLIGMAQAGAQGYFDDAGFPAGAGWDEISFPEVADDHAYALEISGDSMSPVYRDGDRIVVSPAANVRRGDRVVVKTREGEVMVKQIARLSATRVELRSFNASFEDRGFMLTDLVFMHRVVWASQ
ncbi:MAG TPA: helix-turn-helix transcriptional regulator [Rhizomicrobium sp.]